MTAESVWVEGATGKAGKRVTEALAAAGLSVRAASRHPGEPTANVTPTLFDWSDESTWDASIGDADALFLKGLDADDDAVKPIARLIASAPRAEHVVFMSAFGVHKGSATAPRALVEQAVRESGRNWTILRPNWFMQNFDEDDGVYARAIREDDELYAGSGDHRVAFVDVRDVADAAVEVLTNDAHHGRAYDLTGPEALTFAEVADTLATASGRPIRHVDADLDRHRAHFARSGRPDAWIEHMMPLFVQVRRRLRRCDRGCRAAHRPPGTHSGRLRPRGVRGMTSRRSPNPWYRQGSALPWRFEMKRIIGNWLP